MPQLRKTQTAPTIQAARISSSFQNPLPIQNKKTTSAPTCNPATTRTWYAAVFWNVKTTRLEGIRAGSTPLANPPSASQAASAHTHAVATKLRQAKPTPAKRSSAARTIQTLGEPGHRAAIPMPAAKATRIHNAGNFICSAIEPSSLFYGESANDAAAEQPSPYETSEGTSRISALLCSRNPLWQSRQGHAPR